MASSTIYPTTHKGGSFLIEPTTPEQCYSPEDFTEEHRAIARTTEEFWTKEIAPNLDAIQHQEPGVAVSVLRKAGELGLIAVVLPEKYGGMEMDLTSAMLVDEGIAKDGSYAAWHGGQSGIGVLQTEWARVAGPARIQELAQRGGMSDTSSVELSSFNLLPHRADAPLNNSPVRNANAEMPMVQPTLTPQPISVRTGF